eukprot:gene13041-biopygen11039
MGPPSRPGPNRGCRMRRECGLRTLRSPEVRDRNDRNRWRRSGEFWVGRDPAVPDFPRPRPPGQPPVRQHVWFSCAERHAPGAPPPSPPLGNFERLMQGVCAASLVRWVRVGKGGGVVPETAVGKLDYSLSSSVSSGPTLRAPGAVRIAARTREKRAK